MSDSEEEDILFLQKAVLMRLNKKKKINKWQKHWVCKIFCNREESGASNTLVQEVKLKSRQSWI